MKKCVLLFLVLFLCVGVSSTVWSIPFSETFLGSEVDLNFMDVATTDFLPNVGPTFGDRAEFAFDLLNPGGNATLFRQGVVVPNNLFGFPFPQGPTDDFADPNLLNGAIVNDASFTFNLSTLNPPDSLVNVGIDILGVDNTIFSQVLSLPVSGLGSLGVSIDLAVAGVLDQLQDGNITAFAIAPVGGPSGVANTFSIENVTLAGNTVDAPAPIPEPATMFLIGLGLVGLAGFGRKKLKK